MLVFQANETADMLDMTSSRTLRYGNSVYHRLNKQSLQDAPVSLQVRDQCLHHAMSKLIPKISVKGLWNLVIGETDHEPCFNRIVFHKAINITHSKSFLFTIKNASRSIYFLFDNLQSTNKDCCCCCYCCYLYWNTCPMRRRASECVCLWHQ